MAIEQLFELGIAIAGVVARRAAAVILVELLVGVVDTAAGEIGADRVVLARDLGKPARGLDDLEFAVDDPDQQLYENYGCGSPRNYTGYCNPELEQLFDRQSMEANPGTRQKLVWEIERKLAEDAARPIIFYNRFAYCWQPPVKGWTMMVNSIINNFRMEDVWLDR